MALVLAANVWVVATQRSDIAWLTMILTTALLCLRAYSRSIDPYQAVEIGSRVWMAYLAFGSVALSTAFSSHGEGPLSGTERVLLHLGMLLMMMQLHLFAVPPLGHALLVALFMVTAIMSAPVQPRCSRGAATGSSDRLRWLEAALHSRTEDASSSAPTKRP